MSAGAAGLAPWAAYWDARYAAGGKLWGDDPSELARLAVARLSAAAGRGLRVLDVGCGYGRDSLYLAAELGASVLGVDPSPEAVRMARRARRDGLEVEFAAADPVALAASPALPSASPDGASSPTACEGFDVVFASNVYHLLPPEPRRAFAAAVVALMRSGGLLFLSTLSPRDPQHYAVGEPVPGEERSWVERCYLHFCTAEELRADFAALEVLDLEERAHEERHADGRVHRHTSWFLEARRPP